MYPRSVQHSSTMSGHLPLPRHFDRASCSNVREKLHAIDVTLPLSLNEVARLPAQASVRLNVVFSEEKFPQCLLKTIHEINTQAPQRSQAVRYQPEAFRALQHETVHIGHQSPQHNNPAGSVVQVLLCYWY